MRPTLPYLWVSERKNQKGLLVDIVNTEAANRRVFVVYTN